MRYEKKEEEHTRLQKMVFNMEIISWNQKVHHIYLHNNRVHKK